MLLCSLIDAGAPLQSVRDAVRACGVDEVRIDVEEVHRAGLRGLHLRVDAGAPQRERDAAQCLDAVARAGLPERVQQRATATLRRLAAVEAELHGEDPEHVHLHELSTADTLLDVVGVCTALEELDVDAVHYGPLPAGQGTIDTAHGALPLPAPSTLRLLAAAGATLIPAAHGVEHVTPTAAVLLATLGTPGTVPLRLRAVGHGAGTRDDPRRPNIARCWLGDATAPSDLAPPQFDDRCVELATNLDDATPAVVAAVLQRCLDAGALDAWVVAATMKKGRPGHVLHVLAAQGEDAQMAALLLQMAPTLGVRRTEAPRMVAQRDTVQFESPHGPVRVKRKRLHGRVVDARPEMDDCIAVAQRTGLPLHRVVDEITAAARVAHVEDTP